MKSSKLPKWFKGLVYEEGGKVTNPFSGQSYELTADELSMYDFIIGSALMLECRTMVSNKIISDMRKGLDWFRKNNPEAYMILLD